MKSNHEKQEGAVLLTVLVVMTMMIVLIATASSIMNSRIEVAYDAKQLIEKKAAVHGKLNELIYLASTQRFTSAGMSTGKNKERLVQIDGQWRYRITNDELRIDGFEYSEEQKDKSQKALTYSLQSGNGLIPLNTSSEFWLERWLEAYGIQSSQRQKYIDTLHDYIDADSIARAMGAESDDYVNISTINLPTNYFIQDCAELTLMLHWDELLQNNESMVQECSTEYVSSLNINAIPPALLKKLWPSKAEQIVRRRAAGEWFTNIDDLALIVNDLDLTNELLYRFASNSSLIITVEQEGYSVTTKAVFGVGLEQPYTMVASSVTAHK